MKKLSSTIAASGLILALLGCEKSNGEYAIVESGDATFLLNKSSGQTKIISGAVLVDVIPLHADATDPISLAKDWPAVDLTDGIKLYAKTKYRDGHFMYVVEASPLSGRLLLERNNSRFSSITVELYDLDGFVLDRVRLPLNEGVRVTNAKGIAESLQWSGSQRISPDTYRAVSSVGPTWQGFSEGTTSSATTPETAAQAAADAAAAAAEAAFPSPEP